MPELKGNQYSRIKTECVLAAKLETNGTFNSYKGPQQFSVGDFLIREEDGRQYVLSAEKFERDYMLVIDAIYVKDEPKKLEENINIPEFDIVLENTPNT